MPQTFTVPDMDCQSCVRSITEAVHRLDATAQVEIDLSTKLVRITGKERNFAPAIEAAGFTVAA